MRKLKVIDLCCGAGLFSAGMQRAGLEIILGIDIDPVAISSFKSNFPSAIAWKADLLTINSLPECDVIIAGLPCQPFSSANRTSDHKKGLPLVNKFIELAQNSSAQYWIMEEVPPVKKYIENMNLRIEIIECSKLGAKNLRPRLFAGKYPDPVQVHPGCHNPAKTVMASDTTIAIEEIKDLQGVPSWMIFYGTDSEKRTQIGNGVPIQVGEALGMGIIWDILGKAAKGHQDWHETTAAFHRAKGGSRPYRSVKPQKYCYECNMVLPPTSSPGTPGPGCTGIPCPDSTGTPNAGAGGTPKRGKKGNTRMG